MKFLLSMILFLIANVAFSYPTPHEFPPFRIIDNLYYVGTDDLTSYLIVTPEGNILINSNLDKTIPMLKRSIEKLGFKWSDTKILLTSHAHFDHVEGSKKIIEETNAEYIVMDADVPLIETGGKSDYLYGNDKTTHFPKTKVDRIIHNGDKIKLGSTVLTAYLTPGHTEGCTTWMMETTENGKKYSVVILGSLTVNPGAILVNNQSYPNIVEDYKKSFQVLRSLNGEIFLGAHAGYFNLDQKYKEYLKGNTNAFYDPEGYKAYIQEKEKTFYDELAKQNLK